MFVAVIREQKDYAVSEGWAFHVAILLTSIKVSAAYTKDMLAKDGHDGGPQNS